MSSYRSNYRSAYRSAYRVGAYSTDSSQVVTPAIWYDAQDIDLVRNQTLSDGGSIAIWKNKGSMGSAGDLLQGTGALKPIFRLVATAGKINNLSAVESDGTQYMITSAFSTLTQPTLASIVFRPTDLTKAFAVLYGLTQSIWYVSGTGAISVYAGSIAAASQSVPATTWETCVTSFNGAASFNRLNGAQSAALNPGTGTLGAVGLFTDNGANITKGMIEEFKLFTGSQLADPAGIEADIFSRLGATPQ